MSISAEISYSTVIFVVVMFAVIFRCAYSVEEQCVGGGRR